MKLSLFATPLLLCSLVCSSSHAGDGDAAEEPTCSDSDVTTQLSWTNTSACHFYKIGLNYKKLATEVQNRTSGEITMPMAEDNIDSTSDTGSPSVPSVPVDANSPVSKIITLVGGAAGHSGYPGEGFGGLMPYYQKRLLQMGVEYLAKYGKKLIITSAYRSTAHQANLWAKALRDYGDPEVADNWVAPPGRSYHEKRLAIDITFSNKQSPMGNSLFNSGIATQNSTWRPMSNEDWHFEPVESKALRGRGGKIASPTVLDSNITREVGNVAEVMTYSGNGLSKRYEVLELKSRYSQELTLMTTELLLTRNRMIQREKMEDYARDLLGISGYYDESAAKEAREAERK